MTKHPRYEHSLEDLFLQVYVFVDDWLKVNELAFALPKQRSQVARYSELFTIALVGELMAQPFESIWYYLVRQNHQDLFPCLPEYSRYHRITRHAEALWAALARYVARQLPDSARKLIDAKPLAVAKGKRAAWAKLPEARKGFSTMGMVYGFKLHALVSERGLFERWLFAPADVHEVPAAEQLIEGLTGKTIVGDKAYIGVAAITKPMRKNMKVHDGSWTKALSRSRKRIETSFSVLVRSLNLHVAQVKTFCSLRAKVNHPGIEGWRVGREVSKVAARTFNKLSNPFVVVDGEVIHKHELPGSKRRQQHLTQVGQERLRINCTGMKQTALRVESLRREQE